MHYGLEKYEDGKFSETEEGLAVSHAMCAVEQKEARVMTETKCPRPKMNWLET
jgi:hypothetical protein